MRVIAGAARGRQIKAPKGNETTRPTTDKGREAIFGALLFEIPQISVLELISGSGAMGIEALSRGADFAVFVDADRGAAALVRENLKELGMQSQAQVLQMDYSSALRSLNQAFDFIFLDPPYHAGLYQPAIEAIIERKLLAPGGKIIAEHEEDAVFDRRYVQKEKKYGRTRVSFLSIGE